MSMPGVVGIKIVGDASGLTAAVQGAGREIDRFGAQAKGSADAISQLGNGLKSAFIGSSVAVGLIALKNNLGAFTQSMVDAQVQLDKLRNGLNFAVGKSNLGAELDFIRGQTQKLGLEFVTTAGQYTKLAAAARGTSLEGDKIRKVFESVAQASTVMGLSAEQTEGALLALTQIVSKGKVQAEELRGQLGERLPGAFQIAARAMGVTTGELDKMLETGKVLSTDFLPKFAAQLTQEVAPQVEEASQSMQASVNRLTNAWTAFKQTVAGSGVSDAIATEATGISNYLTTLTEAMERAKKSGAGTIATLSTGLGTAVARAPFDALAVAANGLNGALNFLTLGAAGLRTNINILPAIFETNAEKAALLGGRLAAAESDLAALQARLKLNPENIYLKSQAYQAFLLAEELRAAKKAQDDLAGGDATRQGIIANGQGRQAYNERMAQEKKDREAALKKFNETYATPQEKFATALAKEKEALGELFTPAMEKRIRDNFIKPVKAAQESLDEWAKSVRNNYVGAMDEFGKIQDNAIKSTLGLTAAEEKLREIQAGPEFAAMSRRQQENIIMRAAEAMEAEKAAAAIKEVADARKDEFNKLKSSADEQAKSLQRYQDESQAVAIAASQNISLASAVELVAIARLQEAQAIQLSYGDEKAAAAIAREIEDRKKLATLINDKDIRKKTEDENKKMGEDLERIITDGIFRGFENGKGFAENFRDVLENTFKTMVLRPTIKATVDGALGLNGGSGGLVGGVEGFIGGLEKAGRVFEGFSFALTDFKEFAQLGTQDLGAALTKAGFKDVGGYLSSAGGSATVGNAVNIVGKGLSYLEALSNLKDGSWGKAIGQGIGTAIAGPIGGQIGKAIGGIADRIFGGDQGPTNAGVDSSFDAQGRLTGRVRPSASSTSNEAVDQFTSLLGASYQQILTKFGATGKASTFGYQTTSDGFFNVAAAVGGQGVFEQGRTQYTPEALQLASSRAIFAALQASELPQYLSKAFTGIVANTASADQINGALQFAESLKSIRFGLLSATEQAAEYQKIVDASTVSLGTSAATFKQDFIKAIDEGLTPEGLAQWSALGGTLQALEEITGKAADGVDDVTRSLKDIANERKSLQDQLDALTLTPAQLLEKQRNALDESNRALFDQVQTAQAAKDGADALAQAQKDQADAAKAAAEQLRQTNASLQDRLDLLTGAQTERSIELRNATDETTKALLRQIYAQEDLKSSAERTKQALQYAASTATSGAQAAFGGLQRAVSAQKETLQRNLELQKTAINTQLEAQRKGYASQIEAAQNASQAIRGISSALSSAVNSASRPGANTFGSIQEARRTLRAALASGGDLAGFSGLEDAIKIAGQDSQQFYGTFEEYARDQALSVATLQDLDAKAKEQVKSFDDVITSLKAADDLAKVLADAQLGALDAAYKADIEALDATLEQGQQQLNALLGIDDSVKSVAEAMALLGAAIATASAARAAAGGGGYASSSYTPGAETPFSLEDTPQEREAKVEAYTGVTLSANDAGAVNAAKVLYQSINGGVDSRAYDAAANFGGGTMFSGIGWDGSREGAEALRKKYSFAVGTNYVPYDMVAQIHEGEAIVPRAYNPAAGGGSDMVAELKALREEMAAMRVANSAENQAIAINTLATKKALDRVMPDGDALAVRTAV
jgi:tape measure domain-containing protein